MQLSPQTVFILTVILQRLMFQTCSEDAMFLAFLGAGDECITRGIDMEDYLKVTSILQKEYQKQRRRNPLHSMF